MTALSTNYGAPAPKTTGSNYGSNEYSLSSFIGRSKPASRKLGSKKRESFIPLDSRGDETDKDIENGIKREESGGSGGSGKIGKGNGESTERWRWDENEHTARVARGDGHSMESHESRQMIIERQQEWVVEFEGRDSPLTGKQQQNHAL
jgi:hypothetical protein